MRVFVRILRIGSDVLLDQRRKGRLAEIAIAIDARIDKQIDVVRVLACVVQAGASHLDRDAKGAVMIAPAGAAEADLINQCGHSDSPVPRPSSVVRRRSPAPTPARSMPPFRRAECVWPVIPRRGRRCGWSTPCCR